MLDEGTMETTKNERCCRKPDGILNPGDINIQYYYLSMQTEAFIDNTFLMFSDPYQPPCTDNTLSSSKLSLLNDKKPCIDSTLSSLLSLLDDKKVCNIAKHRIHSTDSL